MDLGALYGPASRELQDAFDSRRLADRLDAVTVHEALTDDDVALIATQTSFTLATVDADGWPDVSYKGGAAGFVQVPDRRTLRFPSYDGNGMWRSLGNVVDVGRVALLFVDVARPWRLRIHGTGVVSLDAEARAPWSGAQAVVTVSVGRAFPNCGRYVHDVARGELSPHVPAEGHEVPVPDWKRHPALAPYLPGKEPAARA